MLKLLTPATSPDNPTVPVRWCIEPSDHAKLLELGAKDVHVLLVVKYENEVEDRQLRPLTEALTYVGFRYPGKHLLFAKIVWPSDTLKYMQKGLIQKDSPTRYSYFVLDDDKFMEFSGLFVHEAANGLSEAEPIEFQVDRGHFAKERSDWFRRLVNVPYRYAAVDECHLRKRMVGAILLLPFAIAWSLVASVVGLAYGLLLLSICAREITFRPILTESFPFKNPLRDMWGQINRRGHYCRTAWSFEDLDGTEKTTRVFYSPLFFLIYGSTVMLLKRGTGLSYLDLLWILFVVAVVILLLSSIIRMVVNLKSNEDFLAYRVAKRERLDRLELENSFEYLSCPRSDVAAQAFNLKALPPKRRTIRLRFLDMKRQVCRPFAGSSY